VKAAREGAAANSFEVIAREWHEKHRHKWTEGHATRILERLEKDMFPWIGKRPTAEMTAPELLAALRRIEARGALDTAHRMHQVCSQVFRYAVATGRAERNPGQDVTGALPPMKSKHRSAITEEREVGELMRNIDAYNGTLATRCALKLSAYTFCRPGEIRHMEWPEIDVDKAEWRIPGHKMKMRAIHIVPLSRQALAALEEIRPLTGHGRYVFPSERAPSRCMSEVTVLAALRRMGYGKEDMTAHGFRSMASTRMNESHLWHRDAIECQLAHAERDEIRAAYNYAEHLPERVKMLQWWADYLDSLKAGATVIPLKRTG
jgi:integrase